MAEALLFGERDDRILAAREITKLSTKQKQKIVENGIMGPLIYMLQSQDYESIEAALVALLNLAFGSERNKVSITKSGAIPALLKVLQWRNEALLELALAALSILSSCSVNRPEIAPFDDAIRFLFELLEDGECISHHAKLDIISTLHNLSQYISISEGLGSLAKLIYVSDKSSDLVEKAVALLESLVSSSESVLNQVSEHDGVIGMLVEAVEEGTAACKEHAAAILVAMCRSCRERYRGMILREGAMPGLLQLSVEGNRRGREKAKALLLLLRDGGASRVSHSKSVLFEEVMHRIDRGGRVGNSIEMVEEMIARLRT